MEAILTLFFAFFVGAAWGGSLYHTVYTHGCGTNPPSRSLLCASKVNANCGAIMYEPQSVEGTRGFPETGPPDGHIASGGLTRFHALDEYGEGRWVFVDIGPYIRPIADAKYRLTIKYTYTAKHSTRGYKLFASNGNWTENGAITRRDLVQVGAIDTPDHVPLNVLEFDVPRDTIRPIGVLLLIWEIADTDSAFYSIIDYYHCPVAATDSYVPLIEPR